MTYKICEWKDGAQFTRDATPQEAAQLATMAQGQSKVPLVVSRKAARLALLNAGKLDLVQPAIDALEDPDKTFVQIEWNDSLTFERSSSTLQMIAGAIGLSDAELDALFIAAAALE